MSQNTPEREELPDFEMIAKMLNDLRTRPCPAYGCGAIEDQIDRIRAYGRLCREDGRRVDEAMVERASAAYIKSWDEFMKRDEVEIDWTEERFAAVKHAMRAALIDALEVDRG